MANYHYSIYHHSLFLHVPYFCFYCSTLTQILVPFVIIDSDYYHSNF